MTEWWVSQKKNFCEYCKAAHDLAEWRSELAILLIEVLTESNAISWRHTQLDIAIIQISGTLNKNSTLSLSIYIYTYIYIIYRHLAFWVLFLNTSLYQALVILWLFILPGLDWWPPVASQEFRKKMGKSGI